MTNVRAQARAAVQIAVRRQALHRPTVCSDCGKTCAPHGHHEDYTEALQVVWLCASCHGKRHPDKPARVHVQIPDSLKAAVDAQAAAEQRTIKAVVVRALEAYLAEHQEAAA